MSPQTINLIGNCPENYQDNYVIIRARGLTMAAKTEATIEDLYHVPGDGKAEIVNGELVLMSSTGFWPSRTSGAIYRSLYEHERKTKSGYAFPDNAAFIVNLPNRRSFSPDAAWYTGRPTGMRFLEGSPIFAVEVRSEDDYGSFAEKRMAAKRRDYFAAGTICVWDVDHCRAGRLAYWA